MYVYHITDDAGSHKYGISDDPTNRLNNLQVGNPKKLRLAAVFPMPNRDVALKVEEAIHAALADYNTEGEWFAYLGKTKEREEPAYNDVALYVVERLEQTYEYEDYLPSADIHSDYLDWGGEVTNPLAFGLYLSRIVGKSFQKKLANGNVQIRRGVRFRG